jgi:hypothetical protein
MGSPFALDMGAVMAVAQARGVDLELLADVLPAAEAAILAGLRDEGEEE